MRSVHSACTEVDSGMTPEILEARLVRERSAREQAEALLEEKSRELYQTNITLKKVAEAVESQRVQLETVLSHTLAGIVLTNSELSVTLANRKAKALFGLDEDYFTDLKISDLFDDFSTVQEVIEAQLDAGSKLDDTLVESSGRRSDGSNFPLEFGLTNMELDGRQHSVWVFKDISKRKVAEAKRAALENDLSQAQKMESLGTLASGVAHEINTPIQYVSDNLRFLQGSFTDLVDLLQLYKKAFCDISEDGPFDETCIGLIKSKTEDIDLEFLIDEVPLSIDQSLDGTQQVASIVNAIKEFSHPGEDDKTELDLNSAITTTLTVTRNQWKYVADVETDLAEKLPMVECLSGDINQVLLNLIVNAADAIEARELPSKGKIDIQTGFRDGFVSISIKDNGCGIPDDIIGRIFDPFFTTKGVGKGSGQGLAIAYTIVKQKHNGAIECFSEPGVGTTFTIRLPLLMQDRGEREVA